MSYASKQLQKDIAKVLREAIDKRGYTDVSIAKKLGKSKSWISMILNGQQNLTLSTLADFLEALEFSIEEIKLEDWRSNE